MIANLAPFPAYKDSGVEWLGKCRSIGKCGGWASSGRSRRAMAATKAMRFPPEFPAFATAAAVEHGQDRTGVCHNVIQPDQEPVVVHQIFLEISYAESP